MSAIFRFCQGNHSLSFLLTRPVYDTIVVKVENNTSFTFESDEIDAFSTTLVPLLLPVGRKPPLFSIHTANTFYLRGASVFMVQYIEGNRWTTFTELVAESERLHREDFPPTTTRNSSSSESHSSISFANDQRTEGDEKLYNIADALAVGESQSRNDAAIPEPRASELEPANTRFHSA